MPDISDPHSSDHKRRRTEANNNNNNKQHASHHHHHPSGKELHRQHSKRGLVQQSSQFGRVMESVPCRNKPRHATLSLAIPGSALANCVTKELQTLWAGQIARAATIYHVDEIIVFDDKLTVTPTPWNRNHRSRSSTQKDHNKKNTEKELIHEELNQDDSTKRNQDDNNKPTRTTDPHLFLARLLQYCECPQYLRKHFFPMHPDLQFTGLLPPMDAPHHVRALDRSKYREGVVLEKMGPMGNSLVHCGIPGKPVEINTRLTPGIRCTVQIDSYTTVQLKGTVVSPSAPRLDNGTYWGYTTRLASSLMTVFDEAPYPYDFKIGTSERGTHNLEAKSYQVPSFTHALLVLGGVAGLEECVNADESIALTGNQCSQLFDHWVNICPYQGSRTIRTEEAVWIALAKYSPLLAKANETTKTVIKTAPVVTTLAEFSDEPSEESSEDDDDDDDDDDDEEEEEEEAKAGSNDNGDESD
ncbi:uncharacterized protein FisN_6Lh056 [Fistulifera solaris]|uniref:Uncharacterized protein n=1 Tax=Fistulifera solaris TaxID=1519565 RepID=A0A1Z5KPM6_FISSO|nr:uncharacterized protein FisN_6Lh056 [Fistulifera solaris]|eukprot:GAX28127.1 uncharacterized protein FisN_6Lh056 [Fistulifera solaris]